MFRGKGVLQGVIVFPGNETAGLSMFGFLGILLESFEPLGSPGKRSDSSGGWMPAFCRLIGCRLVWEWLTVFSRLDLGLFGEVLWPNREAERQPVWK